MQENERAQGGAFSEAIVAAAATNKERIVIGLVTYQMKVKILSI